MPNQKSFVGDKFPGFYKDKYGKHIAQPWYIQIYTIYTYHNHWVLYNYHCSMLHKRIWNKPIAIHTHSIEPTHTRNIATQATSYDLLVKCECVYYKRREDKLPWDSQDPLQV